MPDIDDFLREQAKKLREKDEPSRTRDDWEKRRAALRDKMFAAIGEVPAKPGDLEPRIIGTLKRDGYVIEKLVFQSRPNVWVTATAYVPEAKEKVPAVLVVHGHWPFARRDPVVQSRCLGLAKLGFFVLAVDAFGAGERFTNPGRGTYHGALYGSTLWPVGHSLLGMQVYDNRRAIDYLLTRPEVNGKFGVTGASGGGNQSMYAGALDERINAVVPVCSVGNYQAYLKAACCVCEVLPGALQFTEEGDVLGLVAPRALHVMNASKDAIQFSPAEAVKSLERAKHIYKLLDVDAKVRHTIFESTHDYNQPMREAMYGWMTLHLKGEGKGEPIPEPKLAIEKPEELACFPDPNDRPKGFYFPPSFAYAVGKELVAKADKLAPDHPEMWEATALTMRKELGKVIGPMPEMPKQPDDPVLAIGGGETERYDFKARAEEGITISTNGEERFDLLKPKEASFKCLILHEDGGDRAKKHPVYQAMFQRWAPVCTFEFRGTGANKPKQNAVAGAPDHNSAEHALWIGRPLLGQWAGDVRAVATRFAELSGKNKKMLVVGIGHAAPIALVAAALFPERIQSTILIDPPVSYLSETAYAAGTPMGILAPGILKVGDIPHLAGLIAPRRLIIAGGVTLNGKKLAEKELHEAFAFTSKVYKATKAAEKLTIAEKVDWAKIDI